MNPIQNLSWQAILQTLLTGACFWALTRIGLSSTLQLMAGVGILVIGDAVWRRREGASLGQRLQQPAFLGGLSWLFLIILLPDPLAKIMATVGYVIWVGWLRIWGTAKSWLIAAVNQFLILWVIFLAEAIWRWPAVLVLGLSWLGSWLVAKNLLTEQEPRLANVLSAAWALIVSQCAWVFSIWLVNYILFGGLLIVPQGAIVLTALGYCLSGIYLSHTRGQLSAARLTEYLFIGLVLLVIVITGTRWSGAIN